MILYQRNYHPYKDENKSPKIKKNMVLISKKTTHTLGVP